MTEEKKYPDFPDWIKSKEGESCLTWPVGDITYLKNRLFWAFDAGRNCVWHQYLQNKSELKRKDEEIQQLKQALKEIHKIAFEEFYTEYELLQSIKNKLIELNRP